MRYGYNVARAASNPSAGALALAIGLVMAALILGSDVYGLLMPFDAKVKDGRLDVSAYPLKSSHMSLRLDEIREVSLLFAMPEGFEGLEHNSLFGRWRGFYEAPGLGEVVVLIEEEQPPFIYVRGARAGSTEVKQLLLRWRDEQTTRNLFDAIEAELQRRAALRRN